MTTNKASTSAWAPRAVGDTGGETVLIGVEVADGVDDEVAVEVGVEVDVEVAVVGTLIAETVSLPIAKASPLGITATPTPKEK